MIHISHLSFSYDNDNPILSNINITIKKGEFITILGKNGSGKTSLGYCLNGLIPHSFSGEMTGEVTINGKNTKGMTVGNISRLIGTVFQDPNLVIFNLTVEEEVAFGVHNLKLDNPKARIHKALAEVGLEDYAQKDPNTLSEGQKQKLCIACILAMDTEHILLDEPISHLDYPNSRMIYDLLKQLNEKGKTIIIIEHDTDFVWEYSHRTIVLNEGSIVLDGASREVMKKREELVGFGVKPRS